MKLILILAALSAAGLGQILKWVITRHWHTVVVDPARLAFPRMCPACECRDANSTLILEKSDDRTTKNYVVAFKVEWWTANVPYCDACAGKLIADQAIGLTLGIVCAVGAFFLVPFPTGTNPILMVCYVLFGYPVYAWVTTRRKGIVLGAATEAMMLVAAKKKRYAELLSLLNRDPLSEDPDPEE